MKSKFVSDKNPMKTAFARVWLGLYFIVIFFVSFPVMGQENHTVTPREPEDELTWEESFVKNNIAVSKWFDGIAESLDLFLVGRRVTLFPNKSNFRIDNDTISTDGHGTINTFSLIVNPRLPNLEEYWHLKFATYDERSEIRNAKVAYLRQSPRQKKYGATVGVFRKLGNIRASFQPRIELRNPLMVSHSLAFESIAELENYSINPKLEFYANPDDGVGAFQALNFHFKLTNIFSMAIINQGDYGEKFHVYSVTNGISFGQILTPKSALSYNVFFSSNNRPNYHLENYNLSMTFSKVVYKRILSYQISPNLSFQKGVGFKGMAGMSLNISLNF